LLSEGSRSVKVLIKIGLVIVRAAQVVAAVATNELAAVSVQAAGAVGAIDGVVLSGWFRGRFADRAYGNSRGVKSR
jgi:hypothetical protein